MSQLIGTSNVVRKRQTITNILALKSSPVPIHVTIHGILPMQGYCQVTGTTTAFTTKFDCSKPFVTCRTAKYKLGAIFATLLVRTALKHLIASFLRDAE